jgi:hypothetical protein
MLHSTWMRLTARGATLLLVIGILTSLVASYTVDVSAATSTVQVASGMTAPQPGLLLNGSATNPATGKPFQHMWYGDFGNGLCRIDPDIDTINAAVAAGQPTNGHITTGTCVHFIANFAQFKPGQLAVDPRPSPVELALGVKNAQDIYAVDIQAKTQGIIRLHFLPTPTAARAHSTCSTKRSWAASTRGVACRATCPTRPRLGPTATCTSASSAAATSSRSSRRRPSPCRAATSGSWAAPPTGARTSAWPGTATI